MKKNFYLTLLLLMVTVLIVACSGNNSKTDSSVHVRFTEKVISQTGIITNPTQCTYEFVKNPDDNGNYMLKLTTQGGTVNDPSVTFDFGRYIQAAGASNINADDYKFVVIKLKSESMSGSTFELFFCAGSIADASAEAVANVSYDNSESGWQYILFDLSRANWSGTINKFRLDFTTFAQSDEVMYISEIILSKSDAEYYKLIGVDPNQKAPERTESPEEKAKIDALLSCADSSEKSSYHSYKGETAADENKDIHLGFKNMTVRTAKNDNSDIGSVSYLIRMAKNEIEGTQAILAADKDMTGLKLYVSDFKNSDGITLTTDLLWGYYFEVDGKEIIDPLPPVKYSESLKPGDLDWNNGGNHAGAYIPNFQKYNGFDIAAGENQTFIIKAHTDKDTPSGEYSAIVTVKDKDGKEIKKTTIYVWVWNFNLPEETSCKTLADISGFALYANHKCFNGDDGLLYQLYYDYLLENRICAYDIPYNSKDDLYSDSRAIEYLNNPRVTAFQAVCWKSDVTADRVIRAHNFLSAHEEWLKKSYFYPIDEPNIAIDPDILDKINNYGKIIKENFPEYKLIVPMHINSSINGGDYFTYVSEYVNAWCPHNYFFNTFAEYLENRNITYRMSAALDKKFGTFPERMASEQKGGDEIWWYVTRFPQTPEITLTMNTAPINYRLLFWQQKLYNVDGFLYYSVTDWYDVPGYTPKQEDFPGYDGPISGEGAPSIANPIGLNAKNETDASYPYNVYGNGVLMYIGQNFGEYGPVGSYRLECVRDGIEDFEYLSLLTEKYGKDTVDLIIRRLTTSLSKYTSDEVFFTQMRTALGNLLESNAN